MSASGLLWWEKLYFEIRNLRSQVMMPKDALRSRKFGTFIWHLKKTKTSIHI